MMVKELVELKPSGNNLKLLENKTILKMLELINTFGVKSKEFESYRKKHATNKYGLMFIYKVFGVKSNIFYNHIKPFLVKQMNRFTYNEVTEDTITTCYLNILDAHCGGYKVKKGVRTWVPPYVNDMDNIPVSRWINFIITICRSTVSSRDYHFKKQGLEIAHNDRIEDCLANSFLEGLDYIQYSMKHFIFEKSMESHLQEIFVNRPQNNVLYNMVEWNILEEEPDAQQPTNYEILGVR